MIIVATISKNSYAPEKIEEIVRAGADVLRFNASHGTPEEYVGHIRPTDPLSIGMIRPMHLTCGHEGVCWGQGTTSMRQTYTTITSNSSSPLR
ncbi:MAG: hypothetical protein HY341_02300 [Candidatus Kerfeldbacteria bacterium]|nr:hypothetical protein [Candidatus Kerfeldbacteria bacterium]